MAKRLGVDVRITRALLEIGTMCGLLGRHAEAQQIIRATKAHRDDLPHPGTTLAMVYLFEDRWDDAETELVSVLAAYPDHQLGKAFLGCVHRQTARPGWERLLQDVIDDARDEWAINLARTVLGFDRSTRATSAPSKPRSLNRTVAFPRSYA